MKEVRPGVEHRFLTEKSRWRDWQVGLNTRIFSGRNRSSAPLWVPKFDTEVPNFEKLLSKECGVERGDCGREGCCGNGG